MAGDPAQGIYNASGVALSNGQQAQMQMDASGALKVTVATESFGGIIWGAPVAVSMTGASTTLLAASTTRRAVMIINPVGNAQVSYDLSGGTVTLAGGIPLTAGNKDAYTGAEAPISSVTAIGTNTQVLLVVSGT